MSLLQKIRCWMFTHIPEIYGLSFIAVFSFGSSLLMWALLSPYNTFSYNNSANAYDNSSLQQQLNQSQQDDEMFRESVISHAQNNNSHMNSAYIKYIILKNQGITPSQQSENTREVSSIISPSNNTGTATGKLKVHNLIEFDEVVTIDIGDAAHKNTPRTSDNLILKDVPAIPTNDTNIVIPKLPVEQKLPPVTSSAVISVPEKYRELLSEYRLRVNKDTNYFLENGVWYGYKYSTYKNYGKVGIPSLGALRESGLHPETTLLAISGDTIYFVTAYTKVRLVSDSVIHSIPNKERFLEQVLRDQKYIELDSDRILSRLQSETLKITAGKSKSQKISAIYDYVLSNIEYPETFSVTNGRILSGISAIDTNIGSCGAYVNTFLYMLSFAGIDGARRIDGNVIDASDFPNIGHAWLRLDGKYYDPTFDDTSGSVSKLRTYYALPHDMFYVNRYNFGMLPSNIKILSMSERKDIVRQNLSAIAPFYDIRNYPIFAYYGVDEITTQNKNDTTPEISEEEIILNSAPEINIGEQNITTNISTKNIPEEQMKKIILEKPRNIQDLQGIIPYYEVKNFVYMKQGVEYVITKMDFYTVTPENFIDLMNQIDYNLGGMVLFKWDNGSYRLAYSITEQ